MSRVATQGDWKVGWTRPSALFTGVGQALSRALAHRIRENCSVMARIALMTANSAPMMMAFFSPLPQTVPTRSVNGVELDR